MKEEKLLPKKMSVRLKTLIHSVTRMNTGSGMAKGQGRFWLLRLKSSVLDEADLQGESFIISPILAIFLLWVSFFFLFFLVSFGWS